ncbi:MAG: hypothetical protein Q7T22_03795 [Serpentinimonas sp.]|nr:hypothetical protein [Serpentinimonas sp.]MDO9610856.1 hypothetical protein [Serpentinimonas sp.]
MDAFLIAFLLGLGYFTLKGRSERERIALLGSHLRRYQIEKLMEQLNHGYLRALGEPEAERRAPMWAALGEAEAQLLEQLSAFAADIGRLPAEQTRLCRFSLPMIDRWLPQSTLDLRAVLRVHADALQAAVANHGQRSAKARAHTLMAELMLFQHTCHWFCKSRTVASIRLLARHRTAYEQVLDAIAPATRHAYLALLKGSPRAA